MNTMGKLSLRRFLPAFLLILGGCLGEQGGSDTETFTLGGRVTQGGLPRAQGLVKLIPSDYNPSLPSPGLIRTMRTDSSGRFRFGKLDKRIAYNLIAEGGAGERRFAFAESLQTDRVDETLVLEPARVYQISLHRDSSYRTLDSGVAYFPGTDILARCNGVTPSVMDSIPAGLRRLVVQSRAGWKHAGIVALAADTVRVEADSTGMRFLP
jgi:hypothetical protein